LVFHSNALVLFKKCPWYKKRTRAHKQKASRKSKDAAGKTGFPASTVFFEEREASRLTKRGLTFVHIFFVSVLMVVMLTDMYHPYLFSMDEPRDRLDAKPSHRWLQDFSVQECELCEKPSSGNVLARAL